MEPDLIQKYRTFIGPNALLDLLLKKSAAQSKKAKAKKYAQARRSRKKIYTSSSSSSDDEESEINENEEGEEREDDNEEEEREEDESDEEEDNIDGKDEKAVTKRKKKDVDVVGHVLTTTPPFIRGTLRPYQIEGVNWLIQMHMLDINCVLADEMGLGKTLQTITFLAMLKETEELSTDDSSSKKAKRINLLIVPKSTLMNWSNEFSKFCPSYKPYIFHCPKTEVRSEKEVIFKKLRKNERLARSGGKEKTKSKEEYASKVSTEIDCIITTYEMCITTKFLMEIPFSYIVIDEAHRIKNENSKLSQFVRMYDVQHRLLITGTPLQNNVRELWALLNFLVPKVFCDGEVFDEWIMNKPDVTIIDNEKELINTDDNEDLNENLKDLDQKNIDTNDNDHKKGSNLEEKSEKTVNKKDFDIQSDENVHKNDVNLIKDESIDDEEIQKKRKVEEEPSQMDVNILALRRMVMPFFLRREKNEVEITLKPKIIINLYPRLTEMQRKWYAIVLKKEITGETANDRKALMNTICQLRKVCNHPYLFDGAEPEPFTTDEHIVTNSGKMLILDALLKHLKKNDSRVLIFSQMSRLLDILEDYCIFREYEYRRLDGSTSTEDRCKGIDEFNNNKNVFVYLLTTRAGGLGINLTGADTVIIYDCDWNPQMDLQAMDRAHRIGQKKQVRVYRLITENTVEEKIIERCLHKLKLDETLMRKENKKSETIGKKDLLSIISAGIDENLECSIKKEDGTIDIEEILCSGEKKTKELNERVNGIQLGETKTLDLYKWEGEDYTKRVKKLEEFIGINETQKRMRASVAKKRFFDFQFYNKNIEKLIDEDGNEDELEKEMKKGFDWTRKEFNTYLKACENVGTNIEDIISYIFGTNNNKNSSNTENLAINKPNMININEETIKDKNPSNTENNLIDKSNIIAINEETNKDKNPSNTENNLIDKSNIIAINEETNKDKNLSNTENNEINKINMITVNEETNKDKNLGNTENNEINKNDSDKKDDSVGITEKNKIADSNLKVHNSNLINKNNIPWCEKEVRRYHKIFWERKNEISDIERIIANIEKGEIKRNKNKIIQQILQKIFGEKIKQQKEIFKAIESEKNLLGFNKVTKKIAGKNTNLTNTEKIEASFANMKINYTHHSRSKLYREATDKALLYLYYQFAEEKDLYEIIKNFICSVEWNKLDYFIRTRNTTDLAKRINVLIGILLKQEESAKKANSVQ